MEYTNNNFTEQKIAYWYYDPNANDWGLGGWCCSNCHFKNDILGMNKDLRIPIFAFAGTKYCGNCGCKMIGKKEDENNEIKRN